MKNSVIFIKTVLAVLLFFCVFDMPYGFYELVRFLALIGFGILAYKANNLNRKIEMILYGGLALLFQPFFKIALGKEIWSVVDIIVMIGLVYDIIVNKLNRYS